MLPFHFVECFFCSAEDFQFDVILLVNFCFCCCVSGIISKKSLPRPMLSRFSCMVSSNLLEIYQSGLIFTMIMQHYNVFDMLPLFLAD